MSEKRINQRPGDPVDSRVLRAQYDDLVGILRDRSWRMNRKQRDLLWLVLDQGASYGQLARLSGEHASTVAAASARWCVGSAANRAENDPPRKP